MAEMLEENYKMLGNAVVEQAAKDYQEALCKLHIVERRSGAKAEKIRIECKKMILDCEQFFTGDTIMLFTNLDGIALMKRLKHEVYEHRYNMSKIRKTHCKTEPKAKDKDQV